MKKILQIIFMLFIFPYTSFAENNYSEWHMKQRNGLGFGLSLGTMMGGNLFYDRNLAEKTQLHIQFNGGTNEYKNLLSDTILKVNRSNGLATYRYFPQENGGFYIGGGGGIGSSTINYTNTGIFGSGASYTSKANGLFLVGELGWQGIEGYYFNIGYQPAFYIIYSDDYDVNKIPNTSNHRSTANEAHDNEKNISMLFIGFSWFF